MIRYIFDFDRDTRFCFTVDPNTETGSEADISDFPSWILLSEGRCSHCVIPEGSRRTCPAILSLRPVIEVFNGKISHELVKLSVETEKSRLEAVLPIQKALSSLTGLLLPLSGCPTMAAFRPMAHYHLPMGDPERTVFRTLGMYLLAQYFRRKEGLEPDWDFKDLEKTYEEIHHLNIKLANRIRKVCKEDATVNSLIILDAFGQAVEVAILEELDRIKPLFSAYYKG